MRSFWTLTALLLAMPFVGCSQEQTPDEAMEVIATSLSNNEPEVAWDGLPPSYQKDVDDLVHEFAGKMDPEIWNGGFDIGKKVVRIMDEKREFILKHELLASTGADVQVLKENWDGLVQVLSTLVNSELSNLDELKTIEVETFLAGTGSEFMEQMSALAAVSGQDKFQNEMEDYKQAKFKLISQEGDTGVIEISVPDQETETVEMVKVEGKWIPKELADAWDGKMQEAREALAKIPAKQSAEEKEQMLAQLKMVDTQLTLLLHSKTADEFNEKAGAIAMMAMGAGNFGGGAGPGAGPDIHGGLQPHRDPAAAGPDPGPGPGGFEITPKGGEFTPGNPDSPQDDLFDNDALPGKGAFSPPPGSTTPEVELTVPANEE